MSKTLKFGIVLLVILCVVLGAVLLIDIPKNDPALSQAINTETPPSGDQEAPPPDLEVGKDLEAAIELALANSTGRWKESTYKIDHIQLQDDGKMAIVWLAPIDPETGEFLGREPELAVAEQNELGEWRIFLEDEPSFEAAFKTFQYAEKSLLNGDILSGEQEALPKSGTVYGGYYLPWAKSLEKRLTWSVGHSSCYPIYYCTHAFDFADGTMFPLVAAKGGSVFHWRDTCANGDSTCTNSITIQDKSTTPWTYQIYLHIAQGSVPTGLKKVGTPVTQGQYIANVDDTGYSSGHHVHFMVVTEDTRYFSYSMQSYWGVAEDITFRDVDINWDPVTRGGRPRLAYEAATYGGVGRTYYVSGNAPANPPTGGLTTPAANTYLTNQTLTVTGWGRDDVAVTKVEVLADYNGSWVTIGEGPGGTSFTTNVDFCNTNVPDGYFDIAIRLWDYEGNPSSILGRREVFKNVNCSKNPDITFTSRYLPEEGTVSVSATPGSSDSPISSVEFWFLGQNLFADDRVYLGKDTYTQDFWRVPISTTNWAEANNYIIFALATDSSGNKGGGIIFIGVVDRTPPWLEINPVTSPIMTDAVNITWSGGDNMSGIDHYSLSVKVNDGDFQVRAGNLPASTTSYRLNVLPNQLIVVSITAYDKSGNEFSQYSVMYSEGYKFPYQYILIYMFSGN
ncbi:MAG: peptidoglycan DD-metalloendopeptidase family protein [Brevefilum sp.]|nr:peptidoglycan DD-metalloendopeptidase family protein [Brevefilum sp.]